jgi:hypothetical protein
MYEFSDINIKEIRALMGDRRARFMASDERFSQGMAYSSQHNIHRWIIRYLSFHRQPARATTEINLGHLLHTADNYRSSFRGWRAELRTDGYGAIRPGNGILISSHKVEHDAAKRNHAE